MVRHIHVRAFLFVSIVPILLLARDARAGSYGACVVRDGHTSLPSFWDPDLAAGYVKLNEPTNDIGTLLQLCTDDVFDTLMQLHCSCTASPESVQVEAHRGRIVKFIGDGVLIEFASAVDAVECSVSLQQGMASANTGLPPARHIVLRIGINLGDVMVEESDIYGDGVNIAARLEALAEPGGVLLSETVFSHVRGKVGIGFVDLGPQNLKNMVEPVRAFKVSGLVSHTPTPGARPAELSPKTSIAVLPFNNMSGDPEQEYFADGMVEDIITALSRFEQFFVIARNSCFTYKGKAVDVRQVARDLGVRFVLEGSVRRAGNRL